LLLHIDVDRTTFNKEIKVQECDATKVK